MNSIVSSALILISAVSLYPPAVRPMSGQTRTQIEQRAGRQSNQRQSKEEIISKKIDEKIRRQKEQEERFMLDFLSLPPRERVNLWKEGKDVTGRGLLPGDMDNALIARGVDAAPYLAEVVRNGGSYRRVYALKILCDMDRFVPSEETALPEFKGRISVKSLNIAGRLNPFMTVDGRRIGKEGYESVRWAAEQTRDKDLRFHARQYSGLLEQDLRGLSLQEQIKQWREAVIKCKGILGLDVDASNLSHILKGLLVAQAPESIPYLIAIVDGDPSGYVRNEALTVITLIDMYRMRLRAKEVGREAIEAVRRAVQKGGFKPVKKTPQEREEFWKWFSTLVNDDEVPFLGGSQWIKISMAFEAYYGVKVTKRYNTTPEIQAVEVIPEMRQFVTYLTQVDPFFPSWEYACMEDDEVMHPLFKQKIARYYEQWKRFKTASK